jgi:hypothetical protein
MARGYTLDGRGSIPGRGDFLYSTAFRPTLGPTKSHIQWVPGNLSQGVKRPEREADHSLPSRAEDKNGGAKPPQPRTPSWNDAY